MESSEFSGGLLDLFSTSQTTVKCANNAPLIFVPTDAGKALLYQACCNSWNCPRCGEKRAKYEYGRMVTGARKLAENGKLYMMTITCRGDISVEESEAGYLEWTNRLHANITQNSKRKNGAAVSYAAVVERQKRGHLHTHYLTTFCPSDAYYITDHYGRYCEEVATLNRELPANMRFSPAALETIDNRQMFSLWLSRACVSAGLGVQVRMAVCDVVEGASRYIAKYLFKSIKEVEFPRKMKRVRYSRNWPKLPQIEATSAFAVMSRNDWYKVMRAGVPVECFGKDIADKAANHMVSGAYFINSNGDKVKGERS